jgi:hypothetical protein
MSFSSWDQGGTIEKILKHAHQPLSISEPNSWNWNIVKLLVIARLPFYYTPEMIQIAAYRE